MIELNSPEGILRVTRDGNGYPSIVARNRYAAAWAKGWLHANDRLGQVLLTRMAANGRLMELLGPSPVARTIDRAVRLLRLPGGLDEHAAQLSPRATKTLELYCRGFELGRGERRTFDRVLRLAGVDVSPYTPQDVLLSHRMLCFFGLTSFQQIAEQMIAELIQHGGDEKLARLLLGSAADGIDVEAIRGLQISDDIALLGAPLGGSNAIAVSGKRSASGGALLIADPHLEIGRFPPLIYVTHEEFANGEYAQGLCVPGLPWLTMGRTRHISVAYTYGHGDNVDILIERCENGRCERPDGWQTMRRRTERVKVRGADDELWTYWDNDFGSIAADKADGDLPCVRWAGLHESTAGDVNAIIELPDARTTDEVIELHRKIKIITLGAICADRTGDIGWIHTGRIDKRVDGWTGAYPVPGWKFEGLEALPESARPMRLNPDEGFLAAANELVHGMDGERWVNFPEPAYRLERLREKMLACEAPTLRDVVAACFDEVDTMARRLAPIWAPLLAESEFDAVAKWARRQASPQDRIGRDMLGLFHAVHHEVARELLKKHVGAAPATRALDELGAVLTYQKNLDDALALEHPELLNEIELQNLLRAAWPRAQKLANSNGWNVPLRARFKSIFTQGFLPPGFGFSSDLIDFPGGPTSPFQARAMPFNGELIVGGPAARYCCDMSDEGGWYHVPGGAGELPWGPGYGTGVREWATGKFTALGRPKQNAPNL